MHVLAPKPQGSIALGHLGGSMLKHLGSIRKSTWAVGRKTEKPKRKQVEATVLEVRSKHGAKLDRGRCEREGHRWHR